jgi:signal transduction histidine kinase
MMQSKPKLLLVDDIRENLVALGALVQDSEIEVLKADSGEAALELVLQHDFALALLDVQMPGMNGFELAELMRGITKSRHIPIIFVTAGVRERQYQFKGYESGAVDFLYKPLDDYMVRSKVRIFVDLYRQRSQLAEQNAQLQQARYSQDILLAQLQDAQRKLEDAIRAREEFLAMASQELKMPLTSMLIQAQARMRNIKRSEFAGSNMNPVNVGNLLKTNEQELEQLIRLLDDTLDVSHAKLGKLSLRPERVDLVQLAHEVATAIEPRFKLLDATITVSGEASLAGWWDPYRIRQVIMNLLDNILMHTTGSSAEVVVKKEQGVAIIEVVDLGVGISNGHPLPYKVKPGAATNHKADRIGLQISREIAELSNGAILVESRPDKTTAYVVELPLIEQHKD